MSMIFTFVMDVKARMGCDNTEVPLRGGPD